MKRTAFAGVGVSVLAGLCLLATGANGQVPVATSQPTSAPAATQPAAKPDLGPLGRLGPVQTDDRRVWTVVAYCCADNNLEGGILGEINQMEAALPAEGVEIIVLIDRAKEYDTSDGDWTDARVYRLRHDEDMGHLASEVLARPGELDMDDPATLETFCAAAMRTFPAKHYALLLNGHGGGWTGVGSDDDQPGSDKPGRTPTIDRTREAIRRALDAAGVARLELVFMDTCLMGQLEVAVEMADVAKVLVASEAPVEYEGLPCNKIVPLFAAETDPAKIARDTVRFFGECYDAKGSCDCTLAAVDLSRIAEDVGALKALLAKLEPRAADEWPDLCRSMYFAENYRDRTDFFNGPAAFATIDLLDCLGRMAATVKGFGAEAELKQFRQAFERSILASYKGPARRMSHGLAIHAPVVADILRPGYAELRLSKEAGWLELMKRIHACQKTELAEPQIPLIEIHDRFGKQVKELTVAANCKFEITVKGNNILWVTVDHLLPIEKPKGLAVQTRSFIFDLGYDQRRQKAAEQAAELMDVVMPQYVDGRNLLNEPMPGLVMKVSNGRQTFDATVDYSNPSDLRHCRVPVMYSHPSVGDLRADVYFDTNWLTADKVVAVKKNAAGTPVVLVIEPRPDATVTPLQEVYPEKGGDIEYVGSGQTLWGDGLRLVPGLMTAGTHHICVWARSLAGVGASKTYGYEVKDNPAFEKLMARTDTFRARQLAGEWSWELGKWNSLTGDYDFTDTKLKLTLSPSADRVDSLDYRLQGEADGKRVDLQGFIIVEGGQLPNLKFFTKVDVKQVPLLASFLRPADKGCVRTDYYVAFYFKDGERQALFLWDPNRELVFRAQPPGKELVPPGDIKGTWQTADGNIRVILTNLQFQTWVGGMLLDAGTYKAEGNRLTSMSTNGRIAIQTFDLKGDVLTLTNASGVKTVLNRVK